jgi:phage shock protein C
MFCTRCGLELQNDAAYCSRCGLATGAPAAERVWTPHRLSRPMHDKKIAGVCAGFARYLGVDVTLMRILWVVTAVFTGIGFIAYFVAWICMPRDYPPVPATVVQQT